MNDDSVPKGGTPVPAGERPSRVADRYTIEELLGRGGTASVYRATDVASGTKVALKLLSVDAREPKSKPSIELFEREYHTLAQLDHPRIVKTYDYGVDSGKPYYTMELLDGGDLQELAPLPWQRVCTVGYEMASVLSLLHSRRLVHRDITPRNIRLTSDGKAKLMDFGLLSPIGPATLLAGTPPFVAPELVNSLSLDGRSDLFSLGATLYYALTDRLAFAANRFERLRDAWRTSPAAPSKLVQGVPTALDDVILSMLRVDAGSRPKSAAEVMDQLLPLLGSPPDELLRVAGAFLSTPKLIGRDDVVTRFRKQTMNALRGRGGGLVVVGKAGMGRSRMIDTFVLEAKLVGATTLRASSMNATRPFGVARALALQLCEAAPAAAQRLPPALADFSASATDRASLQEAMRAWLLDFATERPLAIAVDDVDHIDEPSAALLASLTWEAPTHSLVYVVSQEPGENTATALSVIQRHSSRLEVSPLGPDETSALLRSVFGDVPNLQLLGRRLYDLCGGRPRECMTLAQFLVDQGAIHYSDGSWTLPAEIPAGMLPVRIEEALGHQLSVLGPLARRVAAMLALGIVERLSRAQLLGVDGVSAAALDAAIDELLAVRLITGDTAGYALCNESLARLLTSALGDGEKSDIHQELSQLHERSGGHAVVVAYHKLLGHRPEEGLDYVLARAQTSEARTELSASAALELGAGRTGDTFEIAFREAERSNRPMRDKQALWVMLAGMSARGEDPGYFYRIPPAWLERLKIDSGWNDWQGLDPALDPPVRMMMALGAAGARFQSTPEVDRVLSPPEAIKQLVSYVVFSIAVSVRVRDLDLTASLPPLLEPFAPANPMVSAMYGNARATWWNGEGKRERAREGFLEVLEQLDKVTGAELAYVDSVRAAISQTMAEIDASLGVRSVWVERLERDRQDPLQAVGARYIRKVAALQEGDWEAAEAHRQQAELLMLQSKARPMFSTLGQELEAHAMARDLTGLKQVRSGIHAMAALYAGWLPISLVSDAHYSRLCGNLEAALSAARAGRVAATSRSPRSPWAIEAATAEAEVLVDLGRAEEALEVVGELLPQCEREGMRYLARGLSLALALAEAELGRFASALPRVESVIAEQAALGVAGLQLGRSYEMGARIAVWARDAELFERYSVAMAAEYRPGESSVLGALYERLMDEARQAGMIRGEAQAAVPTRDLVSTRVSDARVTNLMAGCSDAVERAHRALALLCNGERPRSGHLFLFTAGGLMLVASNAPCEAITELTAFAQRYVDREIDERNVTTEAIDPAAPGLASPDTWQEPNGVCYRPLLLGTLVDDEYHVTGAAMLSEENAGPPESMTHLAVAIAKSLVASGDAIAVRAA